MNFPEIVRSSIVHFLLSKCHLSRTIYLSENFKLVAHFLHLSLLFLTTLKNSILVPDLFRGNPWKASRPVTDFGPWAAAHPRERIASDIVRSSEWLEEEFIAAGVSKKLGIIGFGFGARHLIETLARDKPSRFGTGICFYGTDMDTSQAQNISVPVLFISGDSDTHCPPNTVQDMAKRIHGAKALVYADRGHGFAHRPESQEEDDDAEDAFAAARTWLHDFLVAC